MKRTLEQLKVSGTNIGNLFYQYIVLIIKYSSKRIKHYTFK
jgi:hypothetical protein